MKLDISLRQVEVFRSVMLTGTVSGAAKMLNVTQPGVSRTLGLLELRLGYRLFERRGRRLVPAPEAEVLYQEVEQSYRGIERIANVALDLRYQRVGALRVATLPALSHGLVPQAIQRFAASRGQVSVFVQSLPSRQIASLVATRQFNVGIVELPLSMPGVRLEPLPEVPIVAMVPADHPLAHKRKLSLKDLAGQPVVLPAQPSYVRYQIDDALSAKGVVPHVVAETPTSHIGCSLALVGAGIALVSSLTAQAFAGPKAVVVPLKELVHSRYALALPESGMVGALTTAFCDELKALVNDG